MDNDFAIPAERPLLRKVANCVRDTGYNMAVDVKRGLIFLVSGDEACTLTLTLSVDEKNQIIRARVVFERNVPVERRQAVAVWCNAQNWKLNFGCWCIDFNDGEVVLRQGVDVELIEVTAKFILNIVKVVLHTACAGYVELCALMHGVEPAALPHQLDP